MATTTEISNKSVKNAFKSIGSYHQDIFPSFYPLPMMDRGGLDQMSDTNLCLQDLVGNGHNNNHDANGNLPSSQSNSNDHLNNHHNLHNVSVSSAISNLMSPTNVGSLSSGLSHLHHSTHADLSSHHHHHHHITSPHTPSVLHEPLEKLKSK